MKYIKIISYCISFLVLYSVNVKGQDLKFLNYEVYNESCNKIKKNESVNKEEISLILYYESKEFEVSKSSYNYDTVITELITKGSFFIEKDRIICRNPFENKSYELKKIDNERLLNKDFPYLKDTLYIKSKTKDGYRLFIGRWKNGKKNGSWIFFKKGKFDHIKLYEDGILIQTK